MAGRVTAGPSDAESSVGVADDPDRPVTPMLAWADALAQRRPPDFDPAAYRRVVVVAAHPDDETLGAGGCLQVLRRSGATVTFVIATDGEAAYPGLDADERRALGQARRAELMAALAVQGLAGSAVHWLGLPDSGLADHAEALRDRLTPLLSDADAYLAPWPEDPHPDHRAAGRAAAAAAPPTTYGWSYPIWMWAWSTPDDPSIPWHRAHLVDIDEPAGRIKRDALGCFTSQVTRGPDGSPPVLTPAVLAHARQGFELLFREPRSAAAPVERFAELYDDGNDPWRSGSWYERRKRAVVMASLPRERYGVAFEPGCGTGELTVDLAHRCARLVASDPVPTAVERARAATAGTAGVVVECDALPDSVPHGPIDLAVFSEVLYYLDDDAVEETLRRTVAVLRTGGDLLVVHWRGWPAEAPRDAIATHATVRDRPELEPLVEHVDEDFLVLVLRRL
ncbi:MAG TPA: bifunctional PIG-L family deacetylase/class I SAM-dependent methyltransferase [Acidimicrobiales bacterium]|nr:bifunctional PIG-L family deacetylase/class I SAM-dependent methyltransferase [Acidimicrobiales bacterium]